MIFNGIEKDYVKVNMGLFRPLTPPVEFYTSNKKHGSTVIRKRFTDEILLVPITIHSDSPIEFLKEEMSTWLYHDEPKKLVFKQVPDRYYLAELEDFNLEEKYRFARGTIHFYLAQANRFGETKEALLDGQNILHEVGGQLGTNWSLTVNFKANTNQYTFESNDSTIVINFNFIKGDTLKVDYEKRMITLNDENIDVGLSLESVWAELNAGFEKFSVSEETLLTYIERYF